MNGDINRERQSASANRHTVGDIQSQRANTKVNIGGIPFRKPTWLFILPFHLMSIRLLAATTIEQGPILHSVLILTFNITEPPFVYSIACIHKHTLHLIFLPACVFTLI